MVVPRTSIPSLALRREGGYLCNLRHLGGAASSVRSSAPSIGGEPGAVRSAPAAIERTWLFLFSSSTPLIRHLKPLPISKGKVRDATRLALQSAVAAASMWAILEIFSWPERFVGVLSAVLVVQPSIGSTLGEAWQRFAATVVGCAIGVTCLALLPSGYGTFAALGVAAFAMNFVAGFRPQWRYGVVAAIALAMGSQGNFLDTAIERLVAIGAGVGVGVAVTFLVWPDRAENRAQRYLRRALAAAARRLDVTVMAAQGKATGRADRERAGFHENFQRARNALDSVRFTDASDLERTVETVERFYNSVLFLNRVTEQSEAPLADRAEIATELEKFRRGGCRIAQSVADETQIDRQDLGRTSETLEQIRSRLTDQPVASQRILEASLLFSLEQVQETLTDLIGDAEEPQR